MANYFDKKAEERKARQKYYKETPNRRLRFAAFVSIAMALVLMVAMTAWLDDLSDTAFLLMRGLTGLFALVFVVLVAILEYRVNAAYARDKSKPGNPNL